eukprot:m.445034 g.445034  ORF g.445034 m.445034 type:complete len:113 (-) comp142507_c0_seq1:96-434(-)
MRINPMHQPPAGDYEEPGSPPTSTHIMMDSELYVEVSNDAGEGSSTVLRESEGVTYAVPLEGGLVTARDYIEVVGADSAQAAYAVFLSTKPTESIPSGDTAYPVFRSEDASA